MDIRRPKMDGFEATKRIREFNKNTVITAQTAFGMDSDKDTAIEAGCSDYISKPIDQQILNGIINKYFNR